MANPELDWAKDLLAQATTAKSVQEQAAYLVSCLGALILVLEQLQPMKLDIEEPVVQWDSSGPWLGYGELSTVTDGLESSEARC